MLSRHPLTPTQRFMAEYLPSPFSRCCCAISRNATCKARDGGLLRDITFRRINITGTRLWPWKWWGDGGPIYISTMLRQPGDPSCDVHNVTFEDIVAVSQNGATLSGLAPGHTLFDITLRRVNITIDRLPEWNYTSGAPGPNEQV